MQPFAETLIGIIADYRKHYASASGFRYIVSIVQFKVLGVGVRIIGQKFVLMTTV